MPLFSTKSFHSLSLLIRSSSDWLLICRSFPKLLNELLLVVSLTTHPSSVFYHPDSLHIVHIIPLRRRSSDYNNDLVHSIDNGQLSLLVLLDLSAVFDTVDHNILLTLLSNRFCVDGTALNWFQSYLSGRSQTFIYDGNQMTSFWPTVLSVEPLVHCVICLSVVCNVLYCVETVRPSEKVSEGVNRKPGSKSSFSGSPPYFYFWFHRYGHRDGRFLPYFCPHSQQSVLDGRNWLSSSKSCAYCRIVQSELKPEVVLAMFALRESLCPKL